MKRLAIDIIESNTGIVVESIEAKHLDCTQRVTILNEVTKKEIPGFTIGSYCIPAYVERWNLEKGMITIYYSSGFEMEIRRILD